MIKGFSCTDFRNTSCKDLQFERFNMRFNIMIDLNNAGKSNFIRALSFAANMVNNPLNEAAKFLIELKARPVVYTLRANVGKQGEDNYIAEESLDSAETRADTAKPYNYFHCHPPIRVQAVFDHGDGGQAK